MIINSRNMLWNVCLGPMKRVSWKFTESSSRDSQMILNSKTWLQWLTLEVLMAKERSNLWRRSNPAPKRMIRQAISLNLLKVTGWMFFQSSLNCYYLSLLRKRELSIKRPCTQEELLCITLWPRWNQKKNLLSSLMNFFLHLIFQSQMRLLMGKMSQL